MNAYNTLNTKIISPITLIGSDINLSKVLSKFEKNSTPYSDLILVCVNSENEYQGILHPMDVLRKQADINTSTMSVLSKNIPILREDDPEITNWVPIAQILIDGSISQILILDSKDRVLGVIRDIDLFNIIPKEEKHLKMTIESIMSPILGKSVFSEVSIGNAISTMRKQNLSFIIVVNKRTQKVDGVINGKTLVKNLYPKTGTEMDKIEAKKWTDLPAINFVEETKIFSSNTTLASIMKFMSEKTVNFCIIEDQKMFYLVDATDVLQFFLKFAKVEDSQIVVKNAPDELIKLQTKRKAQGIITRYTKLLGPAVTLKIAFKKHKSQSDVGRYSTTVEVHLETIENENITAEATEFGAEKAVNSALDKLTGILSEKRERYLKKVKLRSRKS